MDRVTLHYPATGKLAAQEFHFASEDGETFYEVARLPEPGEELPPRDGMPMSYARRYFDQAQHAPGVGIEWHE